MIETLDELLKHFDGKYFIDHFYITNIADNIEDKYDLVEEIENYGHYKVVEWQFDLYNNKMLITIDK